MEETKPGSVIGPEQPSSGAASEPLPDSAPQAPTSVEAPQVQVTDSSQPSSVFPVDTSTAQPHVHSSDSPVDDGDDILAWEAPEFIAQEKNSAWYGALVLGSIVIAALTFLLTRDVVSSSVVLLALAGLSYIASRKPGLQQYGLDQKYAYIGRHPYLLANYQSFSIDEEQGITSVMLMPLKRFLPPVTLYVSGEFVDEVIEELSQTMPHENHTPDFVDRLVQRLRF